jgi:transposase
MNDQNIFTINAISDICRIHLRKVSTYVKKLYPYKVHVGRTTYLNKDEVKKLLATMRVENIGQYKIDEYTIDDKLLSTQMIADKYNVSVNKIYKCVTKLFPYKLRNMKPIYYNEQEVEQILKRINKVLKGKPLVKERHDNHMIVTIKGYEIVIDNDDFGKISNYSWHILSGSQKKAGKIYCQAFVKKSMVERGKREYMLLHRHIMNAPKDMDVDHINGNTLDNRKNNLRLCTESENAFNRGKSKTNTSGYKGVSWNKHLKKWNATICKKEKNIHLGYYNTPQEAHAAYCEAAKTLHGEFARFV